MIAPSLWGLVMAHDKKAGQAMNVSCMAACRHTYDETYAHCYAATRCRILRTSDHSHCTVGNAGLM